MKIFRPLPRISLRIFDSHFMRNCFTDLQVEPASCFQTLFGSIQTGLILKDVSLEVKAGEILAVLGSKGTYKNLSNFP